MQPYGSRNSISAETGFRVDTYFPSPSCWRVVWLFQSFLLFRSVPFISARRSEPFLLIARNLEEDRGGGLDGSHRHRDRPPRAYVSQLQGAVIPLMCQRCL